MKRLSIIAVAAVAALAAGFAQAQAQTQTGLKIAVVNFNRLMQDSPQGRAATEALNTEFAPRQQDLVKLNAALKAKAEALDKNRATMTSDQISKTEIDLRNGQRDLSQRENDLNEDANTRRNEELGKLESMLVKEVQTYAQAQKVDLVLTSNSVAYANNAIDITPNVLAVLKASAAPAATTPAPAGK